MALCFKDFHTDGAFSTFPKGKVDRVCSKLFYMSHRYMVHKQVKHCGKRRELIYLNHRNKITN